MEDLPKSINSYRTFMNETYFGNLAISSFFFIFPSIYSIYIGQISHSLIQAIFWATSILRWSYPESLYLQFIDHTYVKLIFFLYLYSTYKSFNINNDIFYYFNMVVALNIVIFYIIGIFLFNNCNDKNVVFHMIVHAYTCAGFFLTSIFNKPIKFIG